MKEVRKVFLIALLAPVVGVFVLETAEDFEEVDFID
jgi:hypothetical protein